MESLRLDSELDPIAPAADTLELLFRLCLELAPSDRSGLSSPRFGELVLDLLEALEVFVPLLEDERLLEYPDELFPMLSGSFKTFKGWNSLTS